MTTRWYLPEYGEPWEVPQQDPVEAAEALVRRRFRWYRWVARWRLHG